MKTERIYKAQGISAHEELESAHIILEQEFPHFADTKESVRNFELDSERIANILCNTLPGGTLDRLIGKLLMRKATQLVVPLFK